MLTKEYARFHEDMAKKFIEGNYYNSYINNFIKDYMIMRLHALQVFHCGQNNIVYCDDHLNSVIDDAITSYLNYGWSEVIIPNPTNSYYDYLYYNLLCNRGYDLYGKEECKNMRKKLLSKTYLRDVSEYIIEFSFTNDDYYLVKKKIIKTVPFILSNGLKVIDNNYYIIEILPKNENYAVRAYLDSDKNLIEYYIDITNGCGIDLDSKIPYYDDLYLDITITNNNVEVLDEEELENAYQNGLIDSHTYNMAIKTKNKLLDEIKNNSNKYLNLDIKDLLDEI